MKKLLSLLALLVTTVTAMAIDFTDYRSVTEVKDYPAEINDAKLTVTSNGDGTYNVTFFNLYETKWNDNFGDITFSNVKGTTEDGITTIQGTNLSGTMQNSTSDPTANATSQGELYVKFQEDPAKAYATMTCRTMVYSAVITVVFGKDEGWGGGSTGGGETGGETSSIVTVKENFQSTEGSSWGENVTIDWNTQKLVASINLASTGSDKGFLGVTKKGQTAGWNNYGIIFYNTNGSTVQGYAPGQPNNANTDQVTKGEDPVRFEISKDGGVKCQGNVVISASNIAHLTNQSEIVVGAADKPAGAFYNYIKVVPLDWAEVPPVTVVDTKEFKNVAYTTSMGGNGTATVTFTEMSDGTFPMTFVSDDLNVKAENLTKGTDEKGRTTYTGTTKRTDVDVTFTVKAVVYGETTAQKLYMTMDNGSSLVVTVGEDPDYVAPVTYKNTLKVVRGTDTKAYENAEVSVLAKGENKYAVTIPSFTDMDQMEGTIGKLTFEATGVEDGGTLKLTATSAATTQEGGSGWDNAGFTASMDATVTGETLKGTFTVVYPNDATNYTYTLYYGVEPPVAPEEPKDVTVVEKYQADGTGFSKTINVDWDKQKIVASIDFSNGGDDKDILAMTTGDSFTAFQTSTYRTMHWYCNQTDKQISGFFAKSGAGNNNTGRMDVADCLAKFEISKAEGLKVNGEVKMTPTALEELLTGDPIIIGSGESPKFSKAYYNYIKVVSLDWKETTEPEVTEVSNKTYTSNLRILDGETTVVEEAEANVNIIKYSDESYKVTLKNVNMLNKTQDLVFVGKALIEEAPTEATEPLTIIAKSDAATTEFFGEEMSGTFEITEVSAEEIKMGFVLNNTSLEYQGEFNYTEEETPEVYTNNLHIYDAAAPETDLFQADQAKVEFLATATGGFKLTLKDVTLNEKTQDLVFTGMLSAPEPGGQEPLAEEGETTPAEPAMVLNATADEATATFLGTTSATAVFNVIMNDEAETENDAFALTFTITAGEKTLGGEFNYKKKTPDTPDPELFCKENYVADGTGFEWDINVDWDTQKIVMSIDPSTCTGTCEDVIGLGAVPTAWNSTLHLYRTSEDQQLQGYFQTSAGNNNTGKFAETAPFLVEVSKAQGFVVNNEVKIAASAMSYLFTLPTVKMGTGEGANDKSRATYNYVKVVDKDWTAPKDPDTGINATTVAEGEVEFFTVNGVKLNKLQKGLNIVRTADGKVKKVLVK